MAIQAKGSVVETASSIASKIIAYLRKRNLVEGRKNTLYFAKSVAKATGQEAKVTFVPLQEVYKKSTRKLQES